MHLASRNNRAGLCRLLTAAGDIARRIQPKWVTYRFRVENEAVHRLFTAQAPSAYARVCAVFVLGSATAGRPDDVFDVVDVTAAPPRIDGTRAAEWWRETVRSREAGVADVRGRFERSSLPRRRRVWQVERRGEVVVAAVGDVLPEWWNLSGLGNSLEIVVADGASSEIVTGAVHALLRAVRVWFAAAGCSAWSVRCDHDAHAVVAALAGDGFQERPKYAEISAPFEVGLHLARRYTARLSRHRGCV